jgi:hypothetical protein
VDPSSARPAPALRWVSGSRRGHAARGPDCFQTALASHHEPAIPAYRGVLPSSLVCAGRPPCRPSLWLHSTTGSLPWPTARTTIESSVQRRVSSPDVVAQLEA